MLMFFNALPYILKVVMGRIPNFKLKEPRVIEGDNQEIQDDSVMNVLDPKFHQKQEGQRMKHFLFWTELPGRRAYLDTFALLSTTRPLRKHLLYWIFKHDGQMFDAATHKKICRRYGLDDFVDTDFASGIIDEMLNAQDLSAATISKSRFIRRSNYNLSVLGTFRFDSSRARQLRLLNRNR